MAEKVTNWPNVELGDLNDDITRLLQAIDLEDIESRRKRKRAQMSVAEAEAAVNEDMKNMVLSPLNDGPRKYLLPDDHPAMPALGRLYNMVCRMLEADEITDDDVEKLEELVLKACKKLSPDHPIFQISDAAEATGSDMETTRVPGRGMRLGSNHNLDLFLEELFGDGGLAYDSNEEEEDNDEEEEEDMEDAQVDAVGDGDEEMEDTET